MDLEVNIPCIVINWNGFHYTVECIEALLSQEGVKANIHVLDNNSANQEYERLVTQFYGKGINFHYSDVNIGFTRGSNFIIKKILQDPSQIKAGYIYLINNDAVPAPNCLSELYKYTQENTVDLLSCQMLDFYDRMSIDNLGHKMLRSGEIVPFKNINEVSKKRNFGPCAGAGLYSVACLNDIGLFDSYFDTGYEDAEYGLRAKLAGYKLDFVPKAVVYHKGGGSIKKVFNEKYAIKNQKNILYTIIKLYPRLLLLVMLPLIFLRNLIMLIVSIFSLKLNYMRIFFSSTTEFLFKDFSKALKARRNFKSGRTTLSSAQIFSSQFSAILFDIDRAFRFLVKRKKSALDQYR